jgi:hypothetical protein
MDGSTHPLVALLTSSGLPITILLSGTPAYELISMTDVDGQPVPELKMRDWDQDGSIILLEVAVELAQLGKRTHVAVSIHSVSLVVELDVVLYVSIFFFRAGDW